MHKTEPIPICSECGNSLGLENLPMKRPYNRIQKRTNDSRKCTKCGYISDVGLRLLEDGLYTYYQLMGADPLGTFNIEKNKWIQK